MGSERENKALKSSLRNITGNAGNSDPGPGPGSDSASQFQQNQGETLSDDINAHNVNNPPGPGAVHAVHTGIDVHLHAETSITDEEARDLERYKPRVLWLLGLLMLQ